MKQINRAGKNIKYGVINAVDQMINDLNSYDENRWSVDSYTFKDGYVDITDNNNNSKHAVHVWTDGADFYAYPWFILDAGDNGWTGYSANGQAFETVNEEPVIIYY